jgi:hypothetical protein
VAQETRLTLGACAAGLASRCKELAALAAERDRLRSEGAATARAAAKLSAQLAAAPKARPCRNARILLSAARHSRDCAHTAPLA